MAEYRPDAPVVLVGMMGAGKSTVGRRLADALGRPFADSDAEIVRRAGRPVADIFAQDGEPAFRRMETDAVLALLDGAPAVIALGGGALATPAVREAVRRRAFAVWLDAPVPVLLKRLARDTTRPLLAATDRKAALIRLLDARGADYAEADLRVDASPPPGTVAGRIAAMLKGAPHAR